MKKFTLFFLVFNIFFSISILAQYTNIRVSNVSSTDPEEVTIAINTQNPNQLAAGANIKYFYYSNDAGLSWTQKTLTSTLGVWGDPVVIYDGLGHLYFAHLSNPISGYWIDRIVVQKSTDNGITWNDGAGVGFNHPKKQDKEWLAVDLQDTPYKNYIYMSWTEFDNYGTSNPADSSRILFSRSTDHGITWANPIKISDVSGNCIDSDNTTEGAVPTVGPNGEIYIAWAGPLGIVMDRSFDGGVTWGNDIFVTDQPGGWDFSIPGISRCNGMPVTMCDTSFTDTRGNLYVMWSDQRNGTDNTDVFIIKSTDHGSTWGPRIKVNDDITARHQFFAWSSIDQITGFIYVTFYDRRNTTGAATDVYVARSIDGGETFDNFKVSQSSFTPTSSVFFGDYTNIASYDRKVYPIWMRMDGVNLSVWTVKIDDTTQVPVELMNFTSNTAGSKVNLSWQTASELNNRGFEIQRKNITERYASEWIPLGFVDGNNTTTERKYYSFTDEPALKGLYLYRLKQYDYNGSFEYSNEIEVDFLKQLSFALHQNYPNPFNPSTTLGYYLPEAAYVTVKVYNTNGEEVASLVNGYKAPGEHEVNFKAADFGSGVYLYRITAGGFSAVKKMIFMK
jgi:hypothetical protein